VNLSPSEKHGPLDDTEAHPRPTQRPVVVLVVSSRSYRTADFVDAAQALRIDLVVASDGEAPISNLGRSRSLVIDFDRADWSAARIANLKPAPDAVVAPDDKGVVIAAMASAALSIPANPVAAVSVTRDKAHMRGLLENAAIPQPLFRLARTNSLATEAASIGYPCVVKPRGLSGSRGVIRVDNADEAVAAEARIRNIVSAAGGNPDASLLVESFVDGPEVAVEGLLVDGTLRVLALLDKPDPLVGPYFEETMFVTPSRHPRLLRDEIESVVQSATDALGLVTGPIHAEVRCSGQGVVLIEVAARSIGGLCGRSLTFGLLGESLESLILRSALGLPGSGLETASAATGVLMLPSTGAGVLDFIGGVSDALAVSGITDFSQTIANGSPVVPLPEGDRYLGFLFARGLTSDDVERSLREAHSLLDVRIS